MQPSKAETSDWLLRYALFTFIYIYKLKTNTIGYYYFFFFYNLDLKADCEQKPAAH